MRKGIDHFLAKVTKVNNATGEVVDERLRWVRPAHGHKVLAKRYRANKAAKQARKRNR